jgi:hypothetical protein
LKDGERSRCIHAILLARDFDRARERILWLAVAVDIKGNDARDIGSATLRSDRNPRGAEENWDAVRAFLTNLTS